MVMTCLYLMHHGFKNFGVSQSAAGASTLAASPEAKAAAVFKKRKVSQQDPGAPAGHAGMTKSSSLSDLSSLNMASAQRASSTGDSSSTGAASAHALFSPMDQDEPVCVHDHILASAVLMV